ncbi:MAG TPA: FAD-dependent oxidoreductase [Ferruginibacter sp.]|nr:FAD-dependent oxidoreductase [Ferruginibacter sp.]HNA00753.1 FAD-dependent oxidoreductase [Ferruginibacter sp.]HNA16394.1 FAD-dependent oxidoreductase [Ferruginibacter sp.]HNJ94268.1 FAD-dependent oxidoreductase [Ferruginibacter sp.]HNN72180.1 FAD-dependent oxidoreductase [Ferruginibacter sp.]
MKVTIVGAGVIGLCSAYYLQKEGYEVTVIERGDITDGCSFGNMGYISPSHFIPLASPGIIAEGIRHMLSSSSPFYIKPRLNWDLLQWGYHFWRNCNAATVKRNAPHLNNILHLSRYLINDMRDEIGDTFEMEEIGCLMMCKQEKTLQHEFHLADDAEKFGLQVERLRRNEVQQLETDVEVDVAGAVLFKDDCHFDPGKMITALKKHLESNGVRFQLHTTVTGFEKQNNRVTAVLTDKGKTDADELIVATGSWLPVVMRMMGIRLLLQPGKGYSHTYDHVEKNLKYPAILVDGRCAITPWKQRLRIGGTMELSGINNRVLIKRMQGIYESARNFYPGLTIDFPPADKIWNGLRPVTPDGLPYIGRVNNFENVIVAGGHAMLGISEGTGTGKLVSEITQHKTTSVDISAFKPQRY